MVPDSYIFLTVLHISLTRHFQSFKRINRAFRYTWTSRHDDCYGLCGAIASYSYIINSLSRKLPTQAKVNCWFCNHDTVVPYGNRNSWDCPNCDQYNGFQKVCLTKYDTCSFLLQPAKSQYKFPFVCVQIFHLSYFMILTAPRMGITISLFQLSTPLNSTMEFLQPLPHWCQLEHCSG